MFLLDLSDLRLVLPLRRRCGAKHLGDVLLTAFRHSLTSYEDGVRTFVPLADVVERVSAIVARHHLTMGMLASAKGTSMSSTHHMLKAFTVSVT